MVSRTLIRDLPDRSRVVVHLQLRERGDPGELSPVFSVTTDRYEPHGTRSGKMAPSPRAVTPTPVAACTTPRCSRSPSSRCSWTFTWPTQRPASRCTPRPTALYFYRTARGLPGGWSDDHQHAEREGLTVAGYARRVACSILRADEIPLDDVPEQDLAAAFHQFVEDQRERWQDEARAGREQLQAIPTIFELRGYDAAGNAIERRSYPNCAEL